MRSGLGLGPQLKSKGPPWQLRSLQQKWVPWHSGPSCDPPTCQGGPVAHKAPWSMDLCSGKARAGFTANHNRKITM